MIRVFVNPDCSQLLSSGHLSDIRNLDRHTFQCVFIKLQLFLFQQFGNSMTLRLFDF